MTRVQHVAAEEHHPRPMTHPSDATRRRWFIASAVLTGGLALIGWMYFFSGQVAALANHLPGAVASETLKQFATETQSLGAGAVGDFKTTLAPAAVAAVEDVQAELEAKAKLANVVQQMTAELSANTETTADPQESN